MDTTTLQADEIEALTAIYGDDLVFDDASRRNFGIDLQVSDEKCVNRQDNWDKHIKLEFKLPAGYPVTAPPYYTISAPWMSRNKKLQLTSALEEIYADNTGESILYMWIEKARDYLNEGIANSIPHEESEDEDLENSNFDFRCKDKTDVVLTEKIHIHHGEPVMDRRSTFQAHLARVGDVNHAKKMIDHVKENKKLATATHNISAYRISGGPHGTCFQDCDDDGESQAGGRLLHLLQILDAKDVVIVVSRWFGGIQLGADRFKHINHVARDLMDKCGVLQSTDATTQPKDASKKKKAK